MKWLTSCLDFRPAPSPGPDALGHCCFNVQPHGEPRRHRRSAGSTDDNLASAIRCHEPRMSQHRKYSWESQDQYVEVLLTRFKCQWERDIDRTGGAGRPEDLVLFRFVHFIHDVPAWIFICAYWSYTSCKGYKGPHGYHEIIIASCAVPVSLRLQTAHNFFSSFFFQITK